MSVPGGFATLRRLLMKRDYCLYVFGHWIGNIGLWVQRVAIAWLTWQLSESFSWLGIIAFADQAPSILFGLIAGAVVDRVDYMKLLRLTQALTFLHSAVLAVLTLTGAMDIWLLLAMTLLRGTLTAFNRPSRMTVVYVLVGRDLLPSALAFNSMIFNSSRFIGPAVGGGIMAAAHIGWTFAAAAFTILVFSVALHLIRMAPVPPRQREAGTILGEVAEGVRYAVTHAGISLQLSILVLISLFARPVTDLLPGFTADVFGRDSSGLAVLLTCHGLGAMAGGFWLTSRSAGITGLTNVMILSVLFMAALLLVFALNATFWVACLLLTAIGASFIVQGISNQTLIQYAVDTTLRGRVVSLYGLIARGGPALGALIMGFAADHLGRQIPVAAGAAFCLTLWLWAWRQRKPMAAALERDPEAAKAVRPGGEM
jgi:predicted MFS family arabinose efflux permease